MEGEQSAGLNRKTPAAMWLRAYFVVSCAW